jgi:hypothetical protein
VRGDDFHDLFAAKAALVDVLGLQTLANPIRNASMPQRWWAKESVAIAVVVTLAGATLLVGLGRHGVWSPWEVEELAEALAAPTEQEESAGSATSEEEEQAVVDSLARKAQQLGHGWSGTELGVRLPNALVALAGVLVALFFGATLFGARAAAYAMVVLLSMPLFLSMSRLVVFSAFPFLAFNLMFGGAALVVAGQERQQSRWGLGLAAIIGGAAIGWLSAGVLLGFTVPVIAMAAGLLATGHWRQERAHQGLLAGLGLALVAGLGLSYSTGAWDLVFSPGAPTFEASLRRVLLGTFPWTGLLVVGLAVLARPKDGTGRGPEALLLSGLFFAFFAQALWHRHEVTTPMVLWPLVAGAGILLAQSESDGRARRLAAVVCGLLMLLGVRDHVLEAQVVLASLGAEMEDFPSSDVLPVKYWAVAVLLGVGLPLVLALLRGRQEPSGYVAWVGRVFRWLLPRRSRSDWFRWSLWAAAVLLLVHGVTAALVHQGLWFSLLSCVERRFWFGLALVPPVALAAVLLGKLAWDLAGRYARALVPLAMAAACLLALATAHVAIPELSSHFSLRDLLRSYDSQGDGDNSLYTYRVSLRGDELLRQRRSEEVQGLEQLVSRLVGGQRAFGLIKRDDLARVDIRFRKRTGRHLPVVDDSNAQHMLVAGQLPAGESRNPLEQIVPLKRPSPSRRVNANFDDRIELLGIDVEGPGGGPGVCPMDEFTVRYYWHCLSSLPGSYKVFVHIDGQGARINGDHEPADGAYAVRDWQAEDYIVYEQKFSVPMHYRPGAYQIYVGLFQGSRRLPVKRGAASTDNRVRAGVVTIH